MRRRCKCPFCGEPVWQLASNCASCGKPLPEEVLLMFNEEPEQSLLDMENSSSAESMESPRTIEELKSWCDENGMPLDRMRFFLGENFQEPRAFGIYRVDDTYIVYKNKANGERAVRYSGPDEAFAIKELYMKLLYECHIRGIYPSEYPAKDRTLQNRSDLTGFRLARLENDEPHRRPDLTGFKLSSLKNDEPRKPDKFYDQDYNDPHRVLPIIVVILFILMYIFGALSNPDKSDRQNHGHDYYDSSSDDYWSSDDDYGSDYDSWDSGDSDWDSDW